ncbi:hypothetical protein FLP41_04205 [Paracoccus marcusii]|uniref:hypothetical protein n=1 Tax=Paracoccus marcusii TaxID=59779 RepID=UPI002ED09268|nr:hypothetical protein FLP41_04205 [Paracoccus marcusii]
MQHVLILRGQKVRPVQPDQIDRSARVAPCRAFCQHPRYGIGRIGQRHVAQCYAMTLLHLIADRGDEIVGALIPPQAWK